MLACVSINYFVCFFAEWWVPSRPGNLNTTTHRKRTDATPRDHRHTHHSTNAHTAQTQTQRQTQPRNTTTPHRTCTAPATTLSTALAAPRNGAHHCTKHQKGHTGADTKGPPWSTKGDTRGREPTGTHNTHHTEHARPGGHNAQQQPPSVARPTTRRHSHPEGCNAQPQPQEWWRHPERHATTKLRTAPNAQRGTRQLGGATRTRKTSSIWHGLFYAHHSGCQLIPPWDTARCPATHTHNTRPKGLPRGEPPKGAPPATTWRGRAAGNMSHARDL